MLKDFIALIYPHTCAACGKTLYKSEKCICAFCQYQLPKTNYHLEKDNPISKKFWGRVAIETATSYYYFDKGNAVQRLIHQLKYKGNTKVGVAIGNYMGHELKQVEDYNTIDMIIPVPLHPKKKRSRGYNQSDYFAQGLSESMNIAYNTKVITRISHSQSQTKKVRYDRWKNVENIFKVKDDTAIIGKHILLVDDVITTGSTLEACAQELLKCTDVKISFATIACA